MMKIQDLSIARLVQVALLRSRIALSVPVLKVSLVDNIEAHYTNGG